MDCALKRVQYAITVVFALSLVFVLIFWFWQVNEMELTLTCILNTVSISVNTDLSAAEIDEQLEHQNMLSNETIYVVSMGNLNCTTAAIPEPLNCRGICRIHKDGIGDNMYNESKEAQELLGEFDVKVHIEVPFNSTIARTKTVTQTGAWSPQLTNCSTQYPRGVGIIIPFRNRTRQLKILVAHLVPMLRRQRVCYQILVVKQLGNYSFNRGLLSNVGFLELSLRFTFDCVIIHDVDWIPTNDYNYYGCDKEVMKTPRHLAVASEQRGYEIIYETFVGGVIKVSRQHYEMMNGHSNSYWGWGGEDDDFLKRLLYTNLYVSRPSAKVARYREVSHKAQDIDEHSKRRFDILGKAESRIHNDGLTNCNYTLRRISEVSLFTIVHVDIGSPPE